MTIDCVTLETNHLFSGNPIASQHRLRYRSIIQRQSWAVPSIRTMEYDQYDNPAAYYLIWRDNAGEARGVSRLYPTDRPYMLKEHFSFLAPDTALPSSPDVWEGSRFCIDNTIEHSALRQRIARELIVAYLEFGLHMNIKQFIGVMHPMYWKRLFTDCGWLPEWFGGAAKVGDGKEARAGSVRVSVTSLKKVREVSGISTPILHMAEFEKYPYGNRQKQVVNS